jgi:hypothetical protein
LLLTISLFTLLYASSLAGMLFLLRCAPESLA